MQVKLFLLAIVAFGASECTKIHREVISNAEHKYWDKNINNCYEKTGVSQEYINSLYDSYTPGTLAKPKEENCFFACYHQSVGTMNKDGKYDRLDLTDNILTKDNRQLAEKCVDLTRDVDDICLKAYLTEMCYIESRID